MQQSQAEAKGSADAALQKAGRAMENAQAAMVNAKRAAKAAGDNALPSRVVLVPDEGGGQTRISISGLDGIDVTCEGVPARAREAPHSRKDVPDGVVDIVQAIATAIAILAVGGPLARAFARRIETRTIITPAALPSEVAQRLAAIEQAVDSVAVKVERTSEGQRFTTKLLSERTKRDVERVL